MQQKFSAERPTEHFHTEEKQQGALRVGQAVLLEVQIRALASLEVI